MKIVNLGVGCTFGLLVFVTADSLSMVQIADCHSFSFLVLKSFEGNDNQLLFSIQERLQMVSKKRTSEKSRKRGLTLFSMSKTSDSKIHRLTPVPELCRRDPFLQARQEVSAILHYQQ